MPNGHGSDNRNIWEKVQDFEKDLENYKRWWMEEKKRANDLEKDNKKLKIMLGKKLLEEKKDESD